MLRINGHYLYEIGKNIYPLSELKVGTTLDEALLPLYIAEGALEPLLYQSVFRFKTCQQSGAQLLWCR